MIHRIINLLRIGRIKLVDDSGVIQRVQVFEGDLGSGGGQRLIDKVARIAHFGLISVPPIDSEVFLAALGGDRTQTIALGTNHQPSRPTGLQPGDSGLYDVRGATVRLTAEGLLIDCAGLPAIVQNATTITLKATDKVTIDAPMLEALHDMTVVGNLTVSGSAKVDGTLTADATPVELGALRDAFNAHKHTGVKAGTDTSAIPDHTV